ncbi:MAG: uroporphyrinogen decarboxylase [Alphaproteobacteria bacterium]
MEKSEAKPLLRVLSGSYLDTPPIWLMRQAGRYLPEYREVRAKAGSFLDLCFNPALAAEVTLQPVRRFGFDAAILFADILLVPHALGVDVRFEEGEGPRLSPIDGRAAMARLRCDEAQLVPIYETVRRVKRDLGPNTALIGFAGAPWTVATYMIAGRGTPDQAAAKLLAYRDPSLMMELIGRLVEATIVYLRGQIDAGAEIVQLFDTWAGGLSEVQLDDLVLGPTREIIAALKVSHPHIPVIGFPRGIGTHLPWFVRTTGVDAVSLAAGDDIQLLASLVPEGIALQGNLDPLALVAGGEALRRAVATIRRRVGRRPHIFNLGHGILPETPPEHVSELIRLVRERSA